MSKLPELHTERLLLRPFTPADAKDVQHLAGERDIAAGTLSIPHPYEDGEAEKWINSQKEKFERGEEADFAIVSQRDNALIGVVALIIYKEHENAELGYWIGKPYWGNGYCTEAAKAVIDYGFKKLGLNRIHASCFDENISSEKVLIGIGMKYEGCLIQQIKKWGIFKNIKKYAILREEYQAGISTSGI